MGAIRRLTTAAHRFAVSLESHPFARLPASGPSHAHDNTVFVKRIARTASGIVPAYTLFFSWPFAAKWLTEKVNYQ